MTDCSSLHVRNNQLRVRRVRWRKRGAWVVLRRITLSTEVWLCVCVCLFKVCCLFSAVINVFCLQLSNILACEVHGSQSGRNVTAKLLELVTRNHTLSSTTVTGIPMKVCILSSQAILHHSSLFKRLGFLAFNKPYFVCYYVSSDISGMGTVQ